MASLLLIHGAWHGGWCFDRLVPLLAARGHRVAAPTLPGMGGMVREVAAASLDGWADFIVEQARALPPPVILCAHSRGGIVASMAAERAPDAFAALIYLAAFLLPDGESMTGFIAAHPRNEAFEAGLSAAARGQALALSAEAATAAFYGGCSEADIAETTARLIPEPLAPMNTPLAVSADRFGAVPRHYVECTADAAIPLALQRAMQAVWPCASVTTLESAHSPFLSMPDQLAASLHTILERIET
jgi:pimeloyl-ACP methyl ester carboxylesterase